MAVEAASRVRRLTDPALREALDSEEKCRSFLARLRWPDGFVCPRCGHSALAGRGLYQCGRCRTQTSPMAGTIFHGTKLPLTLWFAAIQMTLEEEKGMSSAELARRLGVRQATAAAMKRKIVTLTARCEGQMPLADGGWTDDAPPGMTNAGAAPRWPEGAPRPYNGGAA